MTLGLNACEERETGLVMIDMQVEASWGSGQTTSVYL